MKLFNKSHDNDKTVNKKYSDNELIELIKKALKLTNESRTEAQLCQILENIELKNYKWINPLLEAIKNGKNGKFNSLLNEIKEYNQMRSE